MPVSMRLSMTSRMSSYASGNRRETLVLTGSTAKLPAYTDKRGARGGQLRSISIPPSRAFRKECQFWRAQSWHNKAELSVSASFSQFLAANYLPNSLSPSSLKY